MFTVIEFSDDKKGLFSKLFSGIVHEMPELTKVAVNGGAPYFKIKVRDTKKIPWEDIVYMAGRCASNVLLSKDVKIPHDLKVHRFEEKEFPLITLLNTAIEIFSDLNFKKIRLGISDSRAVLVNRIRGVIDFVSEITIFTERTEKYFRICEQLMDEYGISIVLSDYEESLKLCDVVICENALESSLCFCVNNNGNKKAFEFFGIELPTYYKQKLPEGISDEYFAAALYELCGVSWLSNIKYQSVNFKDEIYSLAKIKAIFQKI